MIKNYLKTELELVEEHSARLKERTQNWRQRKQTLVAREKEIVSADMPIVVPSDIKPPMCNSKLSRATKEEQRAIIAQMEQERDAYRKWMSETQRNNEQLAQEETKLSQRMEEEKAHLDAQLAKLDAELTFVASLLPKS